MNGARSLPGCPQISCLGAEIAGEKPRPFRARTSNESSSGATFAPKLVRPRYSLIDAYLQEPLKK